MKNLDQGTPTTLSGTIVRVLDPGGPDRPWRALVAPRGYDRPVSVRIDLPPRGLSAGDDIHLAGRRVPSRNAMFPDEFRIARNDAEGRMSLAMLSGHPIGMEFSSSQELPTSEQDLLERIGMGTLVELAVDGGARLLAAPGVVAVSKSQQQPEPALVWAAKRFSDPATAAARPPFFMVLDPAALCPATSTHLPPGRLQRAIDGLLSVFDPVSQPPPSPETPPSRKLSALLPVMQPDSHKQVMIDAALASRASATTSMRVFGTTTPPGVAVAGNPARTWTEDWQAISSLNNTEAFAPRQTIPPAARTRLYLAHEIGHLHQAGYGFEPLTSRGGLEAKYRAESFADAVAILSYVADTGDIASARTFALTRAASGLLGRGHHCTGFACLAAVEKAAEIGHESLPTAEVFAHAAEIARAAPGPGVPGDLELVRLTMTAHDPAWHTKSAPEIAGDVDAAIAACASLLDKRDATERLFRLAMDALPKIAFTAPELDHPATARAALSVFRKDIEETVAYLHSTGRSNLVPVALQDAARHMSPPSAPTGPAPSRSVLRLARAVVSAAFASKRPSRRPTESFTARRKMVLSSFVLAGARTSPRVSPAQGGVSVVAPQPPATSPFALPLHDRLGSLARQMDLLVQATEHAAKATGPERERRTTTVNTIAAEVQQVAWAVRTDLDVWPALSTQLSTDQAVAIDAMAIPFRVAPPSLAVSSNSFRDMAAHIRAAFDALAPVTHGTSQEAPSPAASPPAPRRRSTAPKPPSEPPLDAAPGFAA